MLSLRDPSLRARFEPIRRLGAGSFGTVYEVFDRRRGCAVALKTLEEGGARALFRFKREFRSLADVVHPNLIVYHELFSDGDTWFFTMELVRGLDFRSWVRGTPPRPGRVTAPEARDGRRRRPTMPERDGRPATLVERQGTLAEDTRAALARSTVIEVAEELVSADFDVDDLDLGELEGDVLVTAESELPELAAGCDPVRLVVALEQLAHGLCALHEAGKLHRDLKPSNVLITGDGRLVILDFGVVGELDDDPGAGTNRHASLDVVGTPAYMAPEQVLGHAPTSACDWYAVGVMLFEALTGELPFEGSLQEAFEHKMRFEASPVLDELEGVDARLLSLCARLMSGQPAQRPDREHVLDVLQRVLEARAPAGRPIDTLPPGSHPTLEPVARLDPRATGDRGAESSYQRRHTAPGTEITGITRLTSVLRPRGSFFGRERAMHALRTAFDETLRGSTRMVVVHGGSGVGKSALVRRFIERTRRTHPDVVVLTGQCYEQESVPYKALDGVVDALSRTLRQLDDPTAAALLPIDIHALARVFPVLEQVPAVRNARRRAQPDDSPGAVRQRAFGGLCELFTRMTHHAPLIVFVDDLQWGDLDSLAPLEQLVFGELAAPPMLLVGTVRDETDGGLVAALEASAGRQSARTAARLARLELGALHDDEASAMALELLGGGPQHRGLAASIAAEAGGNPLFIAELAEHVATASATPQHTRVGLDEVLRARLHQVPPRWQQLVEIIAVAGRPVGRDLALDAAGLGHASDGAAAVRGLVAARLLRVLADGRSSLVPYHDRIRQSVLAGLDLAQQRDRHRSLVAGLDASLPPEQLYQHLLAIGDEIQAGQMLVASADRAWQALAFERAASLYDQALRVGDRDPTAAPGARHRLRLKLAEALLQAGRGLDAVPHLRAAADEVHPDGRDACQLRLRAAAQRLRAGDLDAGLDLVAEAIGRPPLDIQLPRTPRRVHTAIKAARAGLVLRGPRPRDQAPPPTADQDSLLHSVFELVLTLLPFAPAEMVVVHHQHLRAAMALDTPRQRALALASESAVAALCGARPSAVERLAAEAEHHARALSGDARDRALSYVELFRALTRLCAGQLDTADDALTRAEGQLLDHVARGIVVRRSDRSQVTGLSTAPLSPRALRTRAGSSPEFVALRCLHQRTWFWRGAWQKLGREFRAAVGAERTSTHRLADALLTVRGGWLLDLLDRNAHPDEVARLARRRLDDALAALIDPHASTTLRAAALMAHVRLDLYEHHPSAAWHRLADGESLLDHVLAEPDPDQFEIEIHELRARCALIAAQAGLLEPARARRIARRPLRALRKRDTAWATAVTDTIDALDRLLLPRGDTATVLAALAHAEASCRQAGLLAHAASCRLRHATLVGDAEALERARGFFTAQGAHDPLRCAAMLLG